MEVGREREAGRREVCKHVCLSRHGRWPKLVLLGELVGRSLKLVSACKMLLWAIQRFPTEPSFTFLTPAHASLV